MADVDLMTAPADAEEAAVADLLRTATGSSMERIEQHAQWPVLSRLPVILTARIPLSGFKVRNLLLLEQGQLIRSDWSTTEDIPVKIGRVQLAWSEFEVVEDSMAMRLTRLA